MVGHHVGHGAHAVLVQPAHHAVEGAAAAGLLVEPAVVDDVIAVRRARSRLQQRREVGVRNPQCRKVVRLSGGITERAVPALIAQPGQLRTNLLGMSFLNRLQSWEVRGDKLILRGHP